MIDLNEVILSINQNPLDLKPEVVIAELIQNNISAESICIKNESVFNRPFRKDIIEARLLEVKHYDDMVEISISRDGLYDLLPEGLFHQSQKGSTQSVATMVAEHKRFNEEESKARKFFQPLENEFFYQKVNVEKIEKKFFETISKEKDLHLSGFWKLDPSLPVRASQKILELLPRSKKICGNPVLMQEALKLILDEEVSLSIQSKKVILFTGNEIDSDSSVLGLNTVTGHQYEEEILQYEFKIGSLLHTQFEDFLPGGVYDKVLHFFFDCFTPIEPEIITTFVIDKNSIRNNKDLFLGLNTQL